MNVRAKDSGSGSVNRRVTGSLKDSGWDRANRPDWDSDSDSDSDPQIP